MSAQEGERSMLERAQALRHRLVTWRRHIHAHPELSFQERKTAAYLAVQLEELGYRVTTGLGQTGLTADLGQGAPVFVIRGDMDALPIEEANECQYKSVCRGVMHACGHDMHMSCVLGAAALLAAAPPAGGTVRILFQPAEEAVNADGKSGANLMLENGAADGVAGMVALHVDPRLAPGTIAVREGPLLAGSDHFRIEILGRGSHAAYPEGGIDVVQLACRLWQDLQNLISRRKPALLPAVLSISGLRTGTFVPNVMAESLEMVGILRWFEPAVRNFLISEMDKACQSLALVGGQATLTVQPEAPALVNDPALTHLVYEAGVKLLGKDGVKPAMMEMGSDDFTFFAARVPASYFLLGVKVDEGPVRPHHTPTFDCHEDALAVGAAVLAEVAASYLLKAAPVKGENQPADAGDNASAGDTGDRSASPE